MVSYNCTRKVLLFNRWDLLRNKVTGSLFTTRLGRACCIPDCLPKKEFRRTYGISYTASLFTLLHFTTSVCRIDHKTKILNYFRKVFQIPWLEKMTITLTIDRSPQAFFSKWVPNHYQYEAGARRVVCRKGIYYNLDISNVVDHYLYFGFAEKAHQKLYALCQKDYTVIDVGTNIGSVACAWLSWQIMVV